MNKRFIVVLSAAELHAVLDSLHAHLAGDTSEGDLCWKAHEYKAALRAKEKLADAEEIKRKAIA